MDIVMEVIQGMVVKEKLIQLALCTVIYYNFACRLEEYRVNSETGYVIHNQEHLILLRYFT